MPIFHRSRDTHHSAKQAILTYLTIVTDLDEVIDFRTIADARCPNGAAIDAGVAAHLHVVTDFHPADGTDASPFLGMDFSPVAGCLAHLLHPGFLGRDEGKAVPADHATRIADEPVADGDPVRDADARLQQRIIPDGAAFTNKDLRCNPRPRADAHPTPDIGKRADGRVRPDLGLG